MRRLDLTLAGTDKQIISTRPNRPARLFETKWSTDINQDQKTGQKWWVSHQIAIKGNDQIHELYTGWQLRF